VKTSLKSIKSFCLEYVYLKLQQQQQKSRHLEISPLQYHIYPSYGLITQAFLPLGAYLLFVGIFISAKHVSGDAKLRKVFYESAASQLSLLKTIGVSEMEKEFENCRL
jgi:hypothetical protein